MLFNTEQLELFPSQPGVYLMKNVNGTIIYVGKAKNLRQRLRQYFSFADTRPIIPHLVAAVNTIDTIIVLSEKEALLLENTLIKQHKPKYNALLKDDKTYIALKINIKHPWPMVQLVRYKGKPEQDGLYFGPYISAQAARTTLDIIQKVFPLRQCSDQELVRRTRPCILYDMKRCIAPCVGKCTKEEYDYYLDRTIKFLRGQNKEILKELYDEMEVYSNTLEFEKAELVLRKIRQIEATLEGQRVDKPFGTDADVLGVYREAEEVIVIQLFFRSGKLLGARHFNFSNIAEDDPELISSFLIQNYTKNGDLPEEILIPVPLPEEDAIAEILSVSHQKTVKIHYPQRGEKKVLLEMAYLNAEATYKKEKDVRAIREQTLLEMKEQLRLSRYPKRIECFDNSNISGQVPVSVMVAYTNGEKDKKRYRKFHIKSVDSPDDYASMYESLSRRFKRGKEEQDLPDLLIIDGGKGHLSVALKVLAELDIVTVDVISLAKEQGRHDKGISQERVFIPNIKDPILLRKNSPVLFLLQQIRDEAHRFAITFHRKSRSKQTLKTALLDIPGIGKVKAKLLLTHFGSVKGLMSATREDLEKVKGLSKTNIENAILWQKTVEKSPL